MNSCLIYDNEVLSKEIHIALSGNGLYKLRTLDDFTPYTYLFFTECASCFWEFHPLSVTISIISMFIGNGHILYTIFLHLLASYYSILINIE